MPAAFALVIYGNSIVKDFYERLSGTVRVLPFEKSINLVVPRLFIRNSLRPSLMCWQYACQKVPDSFKSCGNDCPNLYGILHRLVIILKGI